MHSEMRHSDEFKENTHQNIRKSEGPERLHSCSTISSRSKTLPQNVAKSATTRVKGSIIPNPQPKSVATAKQIKKDVPSPETITNEAPKDKNKPITHRKMRSSKNCKFVFSDFFLFILMFEALVGFNLTMVHWVY